jgi:hypothetical protein
MNKYTILFVSYFVILISFRFIFIFFRQLHILRKIILKNKERKVPIINKFFFSYKLNFFVDFLFFFFSRFFYFDLYNIHYLQRKESSVSLYDM